MAPLEGEGSPEPDASPKKLSFIQSLFSRSSQLKPEDEEGRATNSPPPTEQRTITWLPFLNKIPARWRLPLLIAIIMLAVICIVLSAVLSVVLAREGPRNKPQPINYSPILPPSYPLAVKNPYLSAWIPGEAAMSLPSNQAEFWRGQPLGWSVMARVDNQVYSLFGMPNPPNNVKSANVTGGKYTSTSTVFSLTAGNAKFTLNFLSPIFPGTDDASLSQQSLPLSFLSVTSEPVTGQPNIKIYSDIDHQWMGSPSVPNFNLAKSSSGQTHMWTWDLTGDSSKQYREKDNMAQWGQVMYASTIQDGVSMTMDFGKRDDIQSNFVKNGRLGGLGGSAPTWSNTVSGVPVSGYAHDLGKISKAKEVVFGVGMTRDLGIKFYGEDHTYYYRAKYPKREQLVDAVADAFNSLGATKNSCRNLDQKIHDESVKTSGDKYADITTLSLRQIFGSMDITIPMATKDTSKVNAWMKEISSNGDIQTLDIIYPASPLFYWLSPDYIRLMIRPLALYLENGKWPHEWAVHDLGDRAFEDGGYPRAVGHDNGRSEEMPLESTGNLLILAYMYYKSAKDRSTATQFASNHKALFTKYKEYLINHGLVPSKQLSTNDGAGPLVNQTNLAIKAAVGLNAYGFMYNDNSAKNNATDMATKIVNKAHGMSSDGSHLTLHYGADSSWSTMFNLYPDVLLGMKTFTEDIINLQSDYYKKLHSQAMKDGNIGLPIDSRGNYGSSNWMSFAGASGPKNAQSGVGKMFIEDIWQFAANRRNRVALCDRFFVKGDMTGHASPKEASFRARPVVGGHFAFLARGV